jgi:hypothetical protein
MIKFATSTKPAPIKSPLIRFISYGLGLGTAAMAVAQMVSFEEFVEAFREYRFGNETLTVAIALMVITLEVFAVPFLLRVSLSRAARFVSAWFALVLPYVWTILTVHAFVANATVNNAGYFGGFLGFHVGTFALVFDLAWMIVVGLSFGAIGGTKVIKLKA